MQTSLLGALLLPLLRLALGQAVIACGCRHRIFLGSGRSPQGVDGLGIGICSCIRSWWCTRLVGGGVLTLATLDRLAASHPFDCTNTLRCSGACGHGTIRARTVLCMMGGRRSRPPKACTGHPRENQTHVSSKKGGGFTYRRLIAHQHRHRTPWQCRSPALELLRPPPQHQVPGLSRLH